MSQRDELQRSWVTNADAWRDAVRDQRIESRRLVTDRAIVEAVLSQNPRRVLDIGCGEGWLVRALASHGIEATGVDASQPLIDAARALGGGEFHVATYDALRFETGFDVVVANFSLLDDAPLPASSGTLIVQTVHPAFAGGAYEDGWRVETFASFGGEWKEMPWYFRTLASWTRAFAAAGYAIAEIREPLHPERGVPASILFICRRSRPAKQKGRRFSPAAFEE